MAKQFILTIDTEREAKQGEEAIDDEWLAKFLRDNKGRARLVMGSTGIEVFVKVVEA